MKRGLFLFLSLLAFNNKAFALYVSCNNDGSLPIFAVLLFAAGIFLFYLGFKKLKQKRLIENTPTSKIQSLAMGVVELNGKANIKTQILAPITSTPCCYCAYLVEKYVRSGKNSHWQTVAKGNSQAITFELDDGTGKIVVDPKSVELVMQPKYEYTGSNLPANCITFLSRANVSNRGFLGMGSYRMRFKEWRVDIAEAIYVIGTAQTTSDLKSDLKQKLNDYMRSVKNDAQKMKVYDTNGDGVIDAQEWALAQSKIESEFFLKSAQYIEEAESTNNTVIRQGEIEKTFIISDRSEKDLCGAYAFQSAASFIGSIISLIISVAIAREILLK